MGLFMLHRLLLDVLEHGCHWVVLLVPHFSAV